MKKLLITLMLSVAFAMTANAQVGKQFVGEFMFSENGGKTAGDDNIYVGHDLEIKADGGATLSANGFQTARDLICIAKTVGTKTMIYFTLYNADGTNTLTDFNDGDLLLTLEYKTVKGKKVLWTTWGKYQPAIITVKKSGGVYFKKS